MRDIRRRPIVDVVESTAQATALTNSDHWARAFAVLYEPFLWVGERVGLGTLRANLLAGASGRTVELGSGTGLNLPYYPADVFELILTEPEPAMRSRLERTLHRSGCRAHVLDASAERLPFADDSVDTLVTTFVLCTVDAPDVALREIERVLRPVVVCCSSSTSALNRRDSPGGKTAWPDRGAGSRRAAAATVPRSS